MDREKKERNLSESVYSQGTTVCFCWCSQKASLSPEVWFMKSCLLSRSSLCWLSMLTNKQVLEGAEVCLLGLRCYCWKLTVHSPCSSTKEDMFTPAPFCGPNLGRGISGRSSEVLEWPLDVIMPHTTSTDSSIKQKEQTWLRKSILLLELLMAVLKASRVRWGLQVLK